ncbi:MAG: Rpn family recombination-promoting nuclease/putative transposase [Candidatus Binatia bacterium]
MHTDSLFYRLFQTLPQLLFALIDQPADHAARYQFTSEELKQTAFRLDGIFRPPDDQSDWPVFFVEVQFQLDPELYSRLFAEVFLYLRQHRPVHPWHAVVIFPTRTVDPGPHLHYNVLLESTHMSQVYLDEWAQPRQTLMQRLIGVIVADQAHSADEARAVLAQARDAARVDAQLAETVVNLVETILVYKLPTFSRKEIQAMLDLTDTDLKQTRFYWEVFAEGEQEGLQKGHQKGRQEGRQEGERTLVLRLLQRRCGEVTPALREQVTRLSLPQLEALGEALLEFQTLADLEQWLTTHEPE